MENKTKSSPKTTHRQSNTLGKASREQILLAAERLLRDVGYHALSTRKVADACAISVGNLTYHFPSKVKLVEALMIWVCDRYERERAEIKFNAAQSGSAYLKKLIGWMLDDAVTRDTSDLFVELWVLAKHHDFGADIVDRFYQTAASWIVQSLAMYFPEATPKQHQRAAYFILALSEGSVPLFSRGASHPISQKHLVEFSVCGVLAVLSGQN